MIPAVPREILLVLLAPSATDLSFQALDISIHSVTSAPVSRANHTALKNTDIATLKKIVAAELTHQHCDVLEITPFLFSTMPALLVRRQLN